MAKLHYKIHTGKQHGLEDMMEEILDEDVKYSLIILPDSSSNDGDYHLELKDIGIPCLVLDHHIYDGDTFNAVIINNQLSPNYTNKDLTGAGVVFQFCRYIDELLHTDYAWRYVDLAALGIISDMGSVLNYENRYIIKCGLEKEHKNFFFQTVLDKQAYSIGDNLNSISISFYVTPLLNALIRVGTMDEKSRLFEAFIRGHEKVPSTKRGEKGMFETLATQMARVCTNARTHQNADKDKAVENLSIRIENEGLDQHQVLVVLLREEDDFPSTLNGLIAMQLCSKYKKPTLVLRPNNEGYARGSARGPSESELPSLKRYLDSTGLFEYNAGHDMAHGSSIKIKYIDTLLEKADQELAKYDFNNEFYSVNFERKAYDEDLSAIIYDIDNYKSIWGQGCPEPLIAINNIDISKKDISVIGKNKDTIRFTVNGITYIKFHAKEMIAELENYDSMRLEVIGRANVNEWMGKFTPQVMINNYSVCDNSLMF